MEITKKLGMKTITIEINRNNFKYPEYVYKIPVYYSVHLKDFYNKSLEEIEKQYDKKVAINVYKCACNGKDITKEPPPAPKTKEVIDLKIENYNEEIYFVSKVFLIANEYNQANENFCICEHFSRCELTEDIEKYIFSIAIDYLIKGE